MRTLRKIAPIHPLVNIGLRRETAHEILKRPIIVSIDRHERMSYIYGVDFRTGEIIADGNIRLGRQAVFEGINKLGNKKDIMVISEAGNEGFSFSRQLTKAGYSNRLIAPSSIPECGKGQKTDRDDAIGNLNYHVSGLLRYVWIPEATDEDCRELMRYRYELVWKFSKQKQKINSLVKRQGHDYRLTKSLWTKKHYSWLKNIELLPMTRIVLDSFIAEMENLELKISRIDKELDEQFSKNEKYKRLKECYEFLPGIGRVGSMTLVLEGYDLNRFPRPSSLMNYTGLIPCKEASGGRDPALRITKAGNKFLRLAIVGATKHYRDRRFLYSRKGLEKLPVEIRPFMERCQNRLYERYRYLCSKGKPSNKARVAIARELCGFLWELVVKIIPVLNKKKPELLKMAA